MTKRCQHKERTKYRCSRCGRHFNHGILLNDSKGSSKCVCGNICEPYDHILELLINQNNSIKTKGVPLCALEISQIMNIDIRDVRKKMEEYARKGLVESVQYRQSYGPMLPYLGWRANRLTRKRMKKYLK